MLRILLIFSCLILSTALFAQKNDLKIKPFAEFQSKRAFTGNSTKYFGFNFGVRAKCKFKVGFSYAWLRGNYLTSDFPVDPTMFPNATDRTETGAIFISLMGSPLVITRKRINISIPVNLGVVALTSAYDNTNEGFVGYHSSAPLFGEIGSDFDFRLSRVLKFGISISYRKVFTDLAVAEEALNTPMFGLKIKLGRMCK